MERKLFRFMNHNEKQNKLTYENATGTIKYTLRDDVVFHYTMQNSKNALTGLVCALKGLKFEDVKELVVLNPITLNALLKETIMDLKLILNSGEVMNIELQTYMDALWERRSLLYWCRAFDMLKEGEDYSFLKPTSHYCITNQELFEKTDEFFSQYKILNIKNHRPYTDLLSMNVLQLNHTELATRKDVESGLLYWAELFNASTWEEFKELAKDNPSIEEVGKMIVKLSTDDQTAEILEGQRRFREQMATTRHLLEDAQKKVAEMSETIADKEATIADKEATIAELQAEIQRLKEASTRSKI